jgi:hypothetical protein
VKLWAKERFIPMDVTEGGSKIIATLSNLRPSSFPINDYGNRAQSSLMTDCSFRRGFFSQLTSIMTASKNLRPDGEKCQQPTYRVSDLIPHDAPTVRSASDSFPGDTHFEPAQRNRYATVSRDFTG